MAKEIKFATFVYPGCIIVCNGSAKFVNGNLPEIREQMDAIPDDELNKWWGEFFCDDTPEEHASASRDRKLSWAIFDAAANAVDGDMEGVEDLPHNLRRSAFSFASCLA